MPMRHLFLFLALTAAPAAAADLAPLRLSQAAEALGARVLSADAVPLGTLVAARPLDGDAVACIVQLDAALTARTSPLVVEGLLLASDGSLRLPERAETIAERMRLTLP
jgi:hypothetical protein